MKYLTFQQMILFKSLGTHILHKKCSPGSSFYDLNQYSWKNIKNVKRPEQFEDDGYGCGPICCYYAYCIGKKVGFNFKIDFHDYRKKIASVLIEKSLNMNDFCFHRRRRIENSYKASVIVEEETVPTCNLDPAILEVGPFVGPVAVAQPQQIAQPDPEPVFYQTYVAHLQIDRVKTNRDVDPWRSSSNPITPSQKAKYLRALRAGSRSRGRLSIWTYSSTHAGMIGGACGALNMRPLAGSWDKST